MPKKANYHVGHGALDESMAREAKRRLWWGETAKEIRLSFEGGASIPMLLNIRNGQRWQNVKWPNGKTGALPQARKDLIERAREAAKVHTPALVRREIMRLTKETA